MERAKGQDAGQGWYMRSNVKDPLGEVVFRIPTGLRTYAGYIDFTDVPAPVFE